MDKPADYGPGQEILLEPPAVPRQPRPEMVWTDGEHLIKDLDFCDRCHGVHMDVKFSRIDFWIVLGEHVVHYWAPCPTNGQPLLLSIVGC